MMKDHENELGKNECLKHDSASNDTMADIFRQAPAFMCVLRGPDHKFELVNERYLQLIGHRDVEGLTVRQALPEVEGQGFFELLDTVYQSGETFTGTDMSVLLHRSTDKRLERRFIDFVYIALRDAKGEVTGILVHGIDQTERKQGEMILAEREEQLRLATDSADVGLWDVDIEGNRLFWPARVKAMFGISPDKPVTMKDYYDGIHPDDLEHTLTSFVSATDPNLRTQYDAEYRTIGKEDKVIRWVAARGRGIFNEADQCIRVIGTAIDITQRKANEQALRDSEERLRESDRRKDEFLAMLAHELRNPLAPISAAAHILSLAKHDPVKVDNCSNIISRQVKHMTGLIDDLLDMSRVTRGLITLEEEEVELNEVVTHSLEQVSPLLSKHHHQLIPTLPTSPILVKGDKNRLIQVLSNLLNNAAKYTPDSGRIDLVLETDHKFAKISVSDNGIGMEPELIKSVFELFTQASRSADRAQGGLGIGLALSKNLVELHKGQITAVSPGLGKGSQFEILLPLIQ